jgi:hypothetical protein
MRRGSEMDKKKVIIGLCVILILVVLGATAAIRSSQDNEGNYPRGQISATFMTHYGSKLRDSVTRMVLDGTPAEKLRFNSPEEFSTLDDPQFGVFHPDGGGAEYKLTSAEHMVDRKPHKWVHNIDLAIDGIDLSAEHKNEIIAYAIGITEMFCKKINKELGINGIPRLETDQSDLYSKNMIDDGNVDYQIPREVSFLNSKSFKRKGMGCFQSFDKKQYVGYMVILDR